MRSASLPAHASLHRRSGSVSSPITIRYKLQQAETWAVQCTARVFVENDPALPAELGRARPVCHDFLCPIFRCFLNDFAHARVPAQECITKRQRVHAGIRTPLQALRKSCDADAGCPAIRDLFRSCFCSTIVFDGHRTSMLGCQAEKCVDVPDSIGYLPGTLKMIMLLNHYEHIPPNVQSPNALQGCIRPFQV